MLTYSAYKSWPHDHFAYLQWLQVMASWPHDHFVILLEPQPPLSKINSCYSILDKPLYVINLISHKGRKELLKSYMILGRRRNSHVLQPRQVIQDESYSNVSKVSKSTPWFLDPLNVSA